MIPVQEVTLKHLSGRGSNQPTLPAVLLGRRHSCGDAVYSEDLSSEQDYDGLRVINPFTDR